MQKINKIYKGQNITKLIPGGFYEIYCNKQNRFLKFDNFSAVKRYINFCIVSTKIQNNQF